MTDVSRGHRLHVDDHHRMGFRDAGGQTQCDLSLDDDRHDALVDHCMNGLLVDHLKDGDHRDALDDLRMNGMDDLNLVASRVNRNYVRHGRMTGGTKDVSRGLRMNDLLGDRTMDVSLDVNRGLHMNDRMDGRNLVDDHHDALDDHRMNVTDDRNDLKMGGTPDVSLCLRMNDQLDDPNLGAMSHRVMYY